MGAPVASVEVARCETCHGRFLPRPGACPRCGSTEVRPHPVLGEAVVLAATELAAPSQGWPAPHRLALVELPESVRAVALVEGPLPAVGARVLVRRDGERYLARAPDAAGAGSTRGGGLPGDRSVPDAL